MDKENENKSNKNNRKTKKKKKNRSHERVKPSKLVTVLVPDQNQWNAYPIPGYTSYVQISN